MEQEMDKYEMNITSIKKDAGSETLENIKAGNAVDGKTFSTGESVEGLKLQDSAAEEEGEVEHGRSVRWPGKLLEGVGGGAWVGISSPFPPQHPTGPFVEINPRILSPPPLSTDITSHPDLSTSEVLALPTSTSFETPTLDFQSDVFPPRLPVPASNQVTK